MSKIQRQIPTEILFDIFLFIPRSDLPGLILTCSLFFSVAQPLLFQRLWLLRWGTERTIPFVDAMESHPRLAHMIRVLNLGQCFSFRSFGLVKRLLSVATRVDELLIAGHTYGMTSAFLEYPFLLCNIRRIRCCVDSAQFFTKLIPSLPSLRCLQVDYVGRGVTESTGFALPLEGHEQRSLDQLVKYSGPSFVLHSLSSGSHIRHITSLDPLTTPLLYHLGQAVGNQLESLHLQQERSGRFCIHDHHCLPPTLLPSLFPNLQSVAWLGITLSLSDQVGARISLSSKTPDLSYSYTRKIHPPTFLTKLFLMHSSSSLGYVASGSWLNARAYTAQACFTHS